MWGKADPAPGGNTTDLQERKTGVIGEEVMLQRDVSSRDFCRPEKPQLRGSTCRNPQRQSKTPKNERVWLYILVLRLQQDDCTRLLLSRDIPPRPQEEQQSREQISESNLLLLFPFHQKISGQWVLAERISSAWNDRHKNSSLIYEVKMSNVLWLLLLTCDVLLLFSVLYHFKLRVLDV